ncbi:sulfite exporter TauE/SafE family protein [Flavobacterium alkalisoli]|uniref:Sulfite exporter TauE/SafE family protein n=1 Tax=Flavobacterium alkalisoli TaxID=2602769 RepID=A0A5B9FX70_9FLAO|nr:sulfite exporter TauE/SafE family protein [Flavobacterium alkalisoli]QEE50851.1 sulfite exporter TauE/SafE family protein [Flavobacterium alkalisoli]
MLYSALLLGLISSLHCMGMCGPIAMMLPVDRTNETKKTIQILLYHIGRLIAYGSLGIIFGLLGRGLYLAGMQQNVAIASGIIMITIIAIPEKKFAKYNFSKPIYKVISSVKSGLGAQFRKKSNEAIFITGLLNGFLPCALVYAALFGAIAMQNALLGGLYMVLYGIGTIPMMSAVVYVSNMLTSPLRNKLNSFIPYAVAIIGAFFILRGLGLGIPYLSPETNSLFVQGIPHCK